MGGLFCQLGVGSISEFYRLSFREWAYFWRKAFFFRGPYYQNFMAFLLLSYSPDRHVVVSTRVEPTGEAKEREAQAQLETQENGRVGGETSYVE